MSKTEYSGQCRGRGDRFILPMLAFALVAGGAHGAISAQPANAPAPSSNVFREQASRLRVSRCTNLFSALGNALANGADHTVQVTADRTAPDGRGVQGVVGMTYAMPDYSAQAAGIVLATPVGQGCEGQMVRVAPFQSACQEVVGLLPAGSSRAAMLSGVPLYDLGGNQGQALLVSSGNGCVVVTVVEGRDVR